MARVCLSLSLSLSLGLALSLVCVAGAQGPYTQGQWAGPYQWGVIPVTGPDFAMTHAALLRKGPAAGQVLIWHQHINNVTDKVWLFNPSVPSTLKVISQTLTANIFCSGHSFDANGDLFIVGGQPTPIGSPAHCQIGGITIPCDQAIIFNPTNITGTPFTMTPAVPKMQFARYYPSIVSLAHATGTGTPGDHLVIGGTVDDCLQHATGGTLCDGRYISGWETYSTATNTWTALTPGSAALTIPQILGPPALDYFRYYPTTHLMAGLPERVIIGGDTKTPLNSGLAQACDLLNQNPTQNENILNQSFLLYISGTQAGQLVAQGSAEDRYYGSSVIMHTLENHDPTTGSATQHNNRVIRLCGTTKTPAGGFAPTSTVEEWDENATPSPVWIQKAPLTSPRVFQNAVILPDGKILVVGGSSTSYHHGAPAGNSVFAAECIDPGPTPQSPGTVTTLASQVSGRWYHSFAILLPDGRVLSAGGDGSSTYDNGEVFSPPYMFRARPRISSAPSTMPIGSTITVTVLEGCSGASIEDLRVALIRGGSVTHAFDFDQRCQELSFVASPSEDGGFSLVVNTPQDHTFAPPGYYMLFVVQDGVPSVAATIRIP